MLKLFHVKTIIIDTKATARYTIYFTPQSCHTLILFDGITNIQTFQQSSYHTNLTLYICMSGSKYLSTNLTKSVTNNKKKIFSKNVFYLDTF